MIDNRVRQLSHLIFTTQKVDRVHKVCVCTINRIVSNKGKDRDKIYFPFPRAKDLNGNFKLMDRVGFKLPSQYLVDVYSKMKFKFMENLYVHMDKKMKGEPAKVKVKKEFPLNKYVQMVLKEKEKFINQKGKLDSSLIRGYLKLGKDDSFLVKKFVDKELIYA